MKQFIKSLFDFNQNARSKSAFAIIVCVVVAHGFWLKNSFAHDDFSLFVSIQTIDFGFISLCLGLKTFENIKTAPKQPTENG